MSLKKQHGGARKGAGRPPKELMYRHQINVSYKNWQRLKKELTTQEINKKINAFLIAL